MAFPRPLLPLLSGTLFVILACGGLGDTGWVAPSCDANCPAWTVQIDSESEDEDGANECFSTCSPVVDCPTWGVPFITDSCYACTHFTEAGELLPLTPNIGPGSFEDACVPGADTSGTHTLMWVDERYEVEDGELEGEVDLVWTRADDLSDLCTVTYDASGTAVDEGCPECDLESGVVLEFRRTDGPSCRAVLTGWRQSLIQQADGGRLLVGYARSWSSWDGVVHRDVIFRFDFDLIYDPSTWIPYSTATVSGSGDLPSSIQTHELWFNEQIDLSSDYSSWYSAARQHDEDSAEPAPRDLQRTPPDLRR